MALIDKFKKYFDNSLTDQPSQIWNTPDTMVTNHGNICSNTIVTSETVDPTIHGITLGNPNDWINTKWTTLNINGALAPQPNYGNMQVGQNNVAIGSNWPDSWFMGTGAIGSPSMNYPQVNVGPSWGNATGIIRYDRNNFIADFYSVNEITENTASMGGIHKQSVVLTPLGIDEQGLNGGRFENYYNKIKNGTNATYKSLLSDITEVIDWISDELEGNWTISKTTSDGTAFYFTFTFASKVEAAHFSLQWS